MPEPPGTDSPDSSGAGQVDFYVLHGGDDAAAEHFACRLTEKAWRGGNRVYLHTDSPGSAGRVDALLWTFREESFVPHAQVSAGEDDTPVQIGHGAKPPREAGVVINLTGEVVPFATDCPRIAEIVADRPERRAAGRDRYRRYREQGFEVRSHDIRTGP